MKRTMLALGIVAATLLPTTQALAAPSGDITHRSCEWSGRHLTTGFPKYDRLLASKNSAFWGNRRVIMVSVPSGRDENGVWHEVVYAICPPAGYQPPIPVEP